VQSSESSVVRIESRTCRACDSYDCALHLHLHLRDVGTFDLKVAQHIHNSLSRWIKIDPGLVQYT
jgi:hypothetical protein